MLGRLRQKKNKYNQIFTKKQLIEKNITVEYESDSETVRDRGSISSANQDWTIEAKTEIISTNLSVTTAGGRCTTQILN